MEGVIRNHPKVVDYFLAVQKFTNDIYLVAHINASVGMVENLIDLGALKNEYRKIEFGPINVAELLYQLWLFPMRVMKFIVPENICMDFFVCYEKITKEPIYRLAEYFRKFSR